MNRPSLVLLFVGSVQAATPAPAQQAGASPHGRLEIPCADCHSADGWKPARISERFDHQRLEFALEGAHLSAPCASCHRSLEFRDAPRDCASCHRDVHLGELGTACARCHETRGFTDYADQIRAHQQTRFPLDGPHRAVACRDCHAPSPAGALTWRNRPTDCVGCHLTTFQTTRNPDHVAAAFPRDCLVCHPRSGWSGARFDHNTTRYPLLGAHAQAACTDCHASGVFRGRDQNCASCHADDFAAAAAPPHRAPLFPNDCTACHDGTVQWHGASFDHARTRFALTGAHQAATCADCHEGGVWQGASMACLSCHGTDFDNTRNPPHGPAGFVTQCATCHTTTAWTGATFSHATFPLTGAHLAAACNDCHGDGVYRGKAGTCVSCHQTQYDGARVPDHRASGFSSDCTLCHSTAGWAGARFEHTARFPLTGGHLAVSCLSCHGDGVWAGKPATCVSCHQADYDRAAAPNHRTSQFPTDCTSCHTTAGWSGARFDHALSQFPLTGAHLAVQCTSCHGDGVYDGKPTSCVACHRGSYDAAANPPHAALNFPTDCTGCHTTAGWPGGRYDHGLTRFPLTGAHVAASCAQCHGDGVYRGKSPLCVSCHQSDFDGTTDPNHRTARFPTDCAACHTTSLWDGARFDHDTQYFPIYTGKHAGTWNTCATCHTSNTSYAVFTCLTCHEHNQTKMDDTHRERSGYRYESTACLSCHPRGDD